MDSMNVSKPHVRIGQTRCRGVRVEQSFGLEFLFLFFQEKRKEVLFGDRIILNYLIYGFEAAKDVKGIFLFIKSG